MSSTLNGLNGHPFVPSSSSSSSSSGSSTPFLAESASFGQFPAYPGSSSSLTVNLSSSSNSSSLNTYFQALTGSLYSAGQANSLINASTGQKSTNALEDQAAAAMSFFNPDQLIKFANGTGAGEPTVDKPDFGLSALNDETISGGISRAAFEFKLNDELMKDFSSSNNKFFSIIFKTDFLIS